ncbi:hypothetical protein HY572_04490 [Candidatus Micrarchaeota archaeon]|nr:hypothetical protein [Candidatus Micrarchaeota archaeon]
MESNFVTQDVAHIVLSLTRAAEPTRLGSHILQRKTSPAQSLPDNPNVLMQRLLEAFRAGTLAANVLKKPG